MRIILTIAVCLPGYRLYSQDNIQMRKTQADTLPVKWLDEVIVSVSRITEKILQSPVSAEKVSEG